MTTFLDGPTGTAEVNDELDRAQVALYRELLRVGQAVEARPVVLRFSPTLREVTMSSEAADSLVSNAISPLLRRMQGWVQANLGGKIALQVNSKVNSRLVLDATGAERLLDKGTCSLASAAASYARRPRSSASGSGVEAGSVSAWPPQRRELRRSVMPAT